MLPKDVKKISLRFAPKIDDGHRGSKYVVPSKTPTTTIGTYNTRAIWSDALREVNNFL